MSRLAIRAPCPRLVSLGRGEGLFERGGRVGGSGGGLASTLNPPPLLSIRTSTSCCMTPNQVCPLATRPLWPPPPSPSTLLPLPHTKTQPRRFAGGGLFGAQEQLRPSHIPQPALTENRTRKSIQIFFFSFFSASKDSGKVKMVNVLIGMCGVKMRCVCVWVRGVTKCQASIQVEQKKIERRRSQVYLGQGPAACRQIDCFMRLFVLNSGTPDLDWGCVGACECVCAARLWESSLLSGDALELERRRRS